MNALHGTTRKRPSARTAHVARRIDKSKSKLYTIYDDFITSLCQLVIIRTSLHPIR